MHRITRCHRVFLTINQHFTPPFDKVVDLLFVLMGVVVRRDTPLNHMAGEVAQSQQTRSLRWISVFAPSACQYGPNNFALMSDIGN